MAGVVCRVCDLENAEGARFCSACGAALVGIWFGKGMSLVIPGFVPSQLGEMVEYRPSLVETLVSVGIWCFGLLLLSVLVRLEHVAAREAAPVRSP